jgi:hypothetical protein
MPSSRSDRFWCILVFGVFSENLANGQEDGKTHIVFIGMIQRMAGAGIPNAQNLSRALVQQALVDPTR